MEVEQEIRARATFDGRLVRVEDFLNHRVEPDLINAAGESIAEGSSDLEYDVILTAEASGIPVAMAVATATGRPFVYAKKHLLAPADTYRRTVDSPTKGMTIDLAVAPSVLAGTSPVLIVDDFLAGGSTACALVDLAGDAGRPVAAVWAVIEKGFSEGRGRLERDGIEVRSLVRIEQPDELRRTGTAG